MGYGGDGVYEGILFLLLLSARFDFGKWITSSSFFSILHFVRTGSSRIPPLSTFTIRFRIQTITTRKEFPVDIFISPFLLLLLSTLRWHTLGERKKENLSFVVGHFWAVPTQLKETKTKLCVREHQPERLAGSIGCVGEGGIKNTPSPHPLLYIFIYFLLLDIVYSLSYIDKSIFLPSSSSYISNLCLSY